MRNRTGLAPSTTPDSTTPVQRNAGDVYIAAARTAHNTHCAPCRDLTIEADARAAANGASMARRDRRQLGLRTARTKAVA